MTDHEIRYGSYHAERQNDGTYNVYFCVHTNKMDIVLDGVRGCNVAKIIRKLENALWLKSLDRRRLVAAR